MENNGKKTEYYKVELNGPKDMFYSNWYDRDCYRIETEAGYMTVYCTNVNGKMVDVITGNVYEKVNADIYYKVDYEELVEMAKFNYLTYNYCTTVSIEEVYNELKNIDSHKVQCYRDAINKLRKWFYDKHLDYLKKQNEQQIWEDTSEEREAGYEKFINNIHKNYGNSNTKSNDGVKKKEKKRWNIFNWYL